MGKPYWNSKEIRLKELDDFIKENGNIDNLYSSNGKGYYIWLAFHRYNHSIIDAVQELGYDLDLVMNRKPNGYFDNVENITSRIKCFISKYNKFPTEEEIVKELSIDLRHIRKHGGIYEIKRLMGYQEDNLIDDNGFYNSSAYEYLVAQWLIKNNIPYKREQYPFPISESPYRSDFTLYNINSNPIVHIEVWGMTTENYYHVKEEKLKLYDKYKINLISLDREIISKNRIDKIQEFLKEQISPYLNVELKHFDNIEILPPRDLNDEQLLDRLLSFSDDKDYLPSILELKKSRSQKYYNEVIKRYKYYEQSFS